jgi:ankyrin repeat protein
MRNLPERDQIEKWSQQWEQIKQFMVLESQIERAKENMEAKASLPSDVQSSKYEDHSGLIADQEDNETARNEKNSDSGNLTHEQSGESVLEKHGLFHQEENAHYERNTVEADVEKLETGHAAIRRVIEHEKSPLRKELDAALVNIGLVPPWDKERCEPRIDQTGDHVLIPQTLHLLDNLLLMKESNYYQASLSPSPSHYPSPLQKELGTALRDVENASPWFSGVTEEGDDNSCVSPLSRVLFDYRESPPHVKSRAYQSALDEHVETLTEHLLIENDSIVSRLFKINESLSEKEDVTAKIKVAIRSQLGSMASESSDECSLREIDVQMGQKLGAFANQVSRADFFTQSPIRERLVRGPLEGAIINRAVWRAVKSYYRVKQVKRYRDDCYTLAFHRSDTISEEELYAIFEREHLKNSRLLRYLLISAASVSMIHKVYSMRFDYGSEYEGMIDTLLILACILGDNKAVKKMIDARVDVNTGQLEGKTPLMHACWRGHTTVVSILLEAGAKIHARGGGGKTALIHACVGGYDTVVSQLIEAGVNVDAKDKDGNTALMEACAGGYDTVVSQLLDAGADVHAEIVGQEGVFTLTWSGNGTVTHVDVSYQSGWTALILACFRGHDTIVTQLIQAGANIHAKGEDSKTALMHTCAGGHEVVVSQLIEAGVNVDAKDEDENTALMEACTKGHARIVKQLLDAGADIDAVDNNGKTAFNIAKASGNTEIASMLENARISADETAGSTCSP